MEMRVERTWLVAGLLAALGAAGLTACGSSGNENSGGGGGPAAQTIEIAETEFMLDPATVTVPEPGMYTFHVVNNGGIVHAFEIEGQGIEEETADIDPGGSADLQVEIAKPGEYEIYCPIDGHRERGMEGTVSLGGGGGGTTENTTTDGSNDNGGYGY
jgi:plastocyanin